MPPPAPGLVALYDGDYVYTTDGTKLLSGPSETKASPSPDVQWSCANNDTKGTKHCNYFYKPVAVPPAPPLKSAPQARDDSSSRDRSSDRAANDEPRQQAHSSGGAAVAGFVAGTFFGALAEGAAQRWGGPVYYAPRPFYYRGGFRREGREFGRALFWGQSTPVFGNYDNSYQAPVLCENGTRALKRMDNNGNDIFVC